MAFTGDRPYPKDLIVPKPMPPLHGRRVQFAPAAKQFFAERHTHWENQFPIIRYQTGLGCPVGRKLPGREKTAIDLLSELMLERIPLYYKPRRIR